LFAASCAVTVTLKAVPAVAEAGAETAKCVATPTPVTVRLAVPKIAPDVAVIVTAVADPATPVASPWVPAVLLIVATLVFDEDHVAVSVKSWMVPSLKVPVAVNCCVLPAAIDALVGVTAIDCRAAPCKLEITKMATSSAGGVVPQLVQVGWKPFTVVAGVVFPKKFEESVRALA